MNQESSFSKVIVKTPAELEAVGLEVVDLTDETVYSNRLLHSRDGSMQMEGLHRLAVAFVEAPDTILQELVNAAVRLCGADSAGISIERKGKTDEHYYEWVAIAGEYSAFLGASLPLEPSACTGSVKHSSTLRDTALALRLQTRTNGLVFIHPRPMCWRLV